MPGSVHGGSEAGSVGSHKSQRSNYRVVGKQSNVDEALFTGAGANKTGGGAGAGSPGGADTSLVTKEMLRSTKKVTPEEVASDAVVVTASDLRRLKESSLIVSADEKKQQEAAAIAARESREQASKARKERMAAMEKERKKNTPLSEMDQETRVQKNSKLEKARTALDEELDDVKHLNQMILYAKCVSIRDMQVQEKIELKKQQEVEEKKLDTMMEIERLKALKMYEERDAKKNEERRTGALVITQQIVQRQKDRITQQELMNQERDQVLRQVELMKEEEVRNAAAKREHGKKMMEEVARANVEAIRIKAERSQREWEEEQRIVSYIKDKEARENAAAAELERIAAEKEKETARLRALQEKAQDKQSELDALRAKRAIEAAERMAREKEKREKDKQAAIHADLSAARTKQKADREERMQEQARQEKEEFLRIIEVQKQQEAADQIKLQEERELVNKHNKEIRAQIAANEEIKAQRRRDFLEEGNHVRAQLAVEHRKIEAIKDRKLHELGELGVSDKHTVRMKNYQVGAMPKL